MFYVAGRTFWDLDIDGEFDAAFNWFGSFGFFSEEDNLRFLRRVFAVLKPGGRFLLEGMNKTWLLANFKAARTSRSASASVRC